MLCRALARQASGAYYCITFACACMCMMGAGDMYDGPVPGRTTLVFVYSSADLVHHVMMTNSWSLEVCP